MHKFITHAAPLDAITCNNQNKNKKPCNCCLQLLLENHRTVILSLAISGAQLDRANDGIMGARLAEDLKEGVHGVPKVPEQFFASPVDENWILDQFVPWARKRISNCTWCPKRFIARMHVLSTVSR